MKRMICSVFFIALFFLAGRALAGVDTVPSQGGSVSPWSGTAYQAAETDNGDSGSADTIDWSLGNNQRSTLTGDVSYTFAAPGGPAHLVLRMVQDVSGSHAVTWPAEVEWDGGVEPTWDTTAGILNIASFYYDGTGYYGTGMVGMSVVYPQVSFVPDTGFVGTAADGIAGINTASETWSNLLLTTPNIAASHMGDLGGNANTLQAIVMASSTTDEFATVLWPLLCFNTGDGSILGGATVTGATLAVHGWSSDAGNGLNMNFDLHLVSVTPADPGSFVAADFGQIGASSLDSIAYGSLDSAGPNTWDVPAGQINTGAPSCFALVAGDFVGGSFTGTWASGAASFVSFESAEGTNKPTLTVNYAP